MIKKFLIGLTLALVITGCAHCPTTQEVITPVAIHAKHINIPECPILEIDKILPTDSLDIHLKAWDASIIVLKGCDKAKGDILEELNK